MHTYVVFAVLSLVCLLDAVHSHPDRNAVLPRSREARLAVSLGDPCFPSNTGPVSPCGMKFAECRLNADQRYTCMCRPGFEPTEDGKNCLNEIITPMNATECFDDGDCSNFLDAVCGPNRIVPQASHIPGIKPGTSSTGKRCPCPQDKAEDPKLPFTGCSITLTVQSGCGARRGNSFCRARNPDHVCIPSTQFCGCPSGAMGETFGECMEKKTCSGLGTSECPVATEMDPQSVFNSSEASTCDVAMKRCSCTMKSQAAQPAVPAKSKLAVPAIPAKTPGIPIYDPATKLHQCTPVQAVTTCKDDSNCAKDLNQTCFKNNPASSESAFCLCKSLKRHGAGGLVCNDAFGRCCNPAAGPMTYHCGIPIASPKPGVTNLTCLPASGTCGCLSGYYVSDVGCVATPPNVGATCDPLS